MEDTEFEKIKKKQLEDLKNKIRNYEKNNTDISQNAKNTGVSFSFKISTEIVAALVIGVGIGLVVDNYFGTKPFGLIIFFILGAFAGFLNVYHVMRHIEKQ